MSDAAGSPRSDESATIASWLQQVLPRAIVFARSLTGDHHAAEDIVHDCVCRLIDRKDRYDLPTDGLKLLMRSISNAAIDRLRRVEPRSLETAEFDDRGPSEPMDRTALDPSDIAMSRELEIAIEEGLRKLPVQQRAVLELKGLGMRLTEIATSLDVSQSHAGVLLHRARAAMAKELSKWVRR